MYTNKKTLLALSVASILSLSGCSSDDDKNVVEPVDPVDPPVVVAPEAPAELGNTVTGSVIDGSNSDLVAAQINFLEAGEPATSLVDIEGNAVTSVDAAEGEFTFLLADDATATSVTAVVTADDYVSKSYVIDLAGLSEGDLNVQLSAVALATEGVAAASEDKAVSGGSSADEITADVADGKAAASVSIPAGVTLQDDSGNPIEGSTVTLKVTTADTNTAAGSVITPAGLNAANSATVAKPVGVASVNMTDENGVKITKFSSPITISMAVPVEKGFVTGDELGLSSQNEETGVWTKETEKVTVGALSSDNTYYNASFQTDHLTFFAATTEEAACTTPVRVLVQGDSVPASGLTAVLRSSDTSFEANIPAGSTDATVVSAAQASEKGIVEDTTARVFVKDAEGNIWFNSETEVAVCGDVSVTLENPVELVSESFDITAQCSNDDTVTVGASGALVTYKQGNKASKKATGNGEGSYTLNDLVSGQEYSVTATFTGALASVDTQTFTVTADGENESATVTQECDVATGGN